MSRRKSSSEPVSSEGVSVPALSPASPSPVPGVEYRFQVRQKRWGSVTWDVLAGFNSITDAKLFKRVRSELNGDPYQFCIFDALVGQEIKPSGEKKQTEGTF